MKRVRSVFFALALGTGALAQEKNGALDSMNFALDMFCAIRPDEIIFIKDVKPLYIEKKQDGFCFSEGGFRFEFTSVKDSHTVNAKKQFSYDIFKRAVIGITARLDGKDIRIMVNRAVFDSDFVAANPDLDRTIWVKWGGEDAVPLDSLNRNRQNRVAIVLAEALPLGIERMNEILKDIQIPVPPMRKYGTGTGTLSGIGKAVAQPSYDKWVSRQPFALPKDHRGHPPSRSPMRR